MKGFTIRWRGHALARIDERSAIWAVVIAAAVYHLGIFMRWW